MDAKEKIDLGDFGGFGQFPTTLEIWSEDEIAISQPSAQEDGTMHSVSLHPKQLAALIKKVIKFAPSD